MPTPKTGGLLAFLLRAAPPAPDADADLLDRFVRSRDEAAFAALVRRHGPMVFNVCRRRLGAGPDAEDAFQATFLALARDAGRIANRDALPGWLYRAAYLIALKAAGRAARRNAMALSDDAVPGAELPPEAAAQARELRAALDGELAALPEKLRAVAVLCLLDGRTNAEAAGVLGVPTGTVDSRLHAARKKLQARLARRGAAAVLLTNLTDGPAGAGFDALAARTVELASAYAAGVTLDCDAITSLANGVSTMATTTRKVLAAAVLGLALAGGTGLGVFRAAAGPADPGQGEQKAEAQKPADAAKPAAGKLVADGFTPGTTAATTAVLAKPAGFEEPLQGITVLELLNKLSEKHGVTFRLDVGLLKRAGVAAPYEQQVNFPIVKGMTVQDILDDLIDQIAQDGMDRRQYAFRAKGSQVVLTRAFHPPATPGRGAAGEPTLLIPENLVAEMLNGPPVSVSVKDRPLSDLVHQLREQTGANIVVDARLGKSSPTRSR